MRASGRATEGGRSGSDRGFGIGAGNNEANRNHPSAVKLYLIAGEHSGDARGAELMRALRERMPDVEFFGAGGREMRSIAGDHFLDWADEAVVGIWDVLKKY